jgi:phosphate:Na+ symporter
MDIFSFITLFGGLAMFIYGMTTMSQNLEKVAGGKMEVILNKMTKNRFMGLALGAIITIAIQSSSAVTVMLVGLVNSGIMDIGNTVGVIMGSNIGTTITAWIMSLIGVSSNNFFIRMLKPESFSPILALIGVIMMMVCKSNKKRDVGTIFVGFAILMYGMTLMSTSMSPLAESSKFSSILTAFSNPFVGILVGLVVTAVIQSSAASIGMLQALAMTGKITWGMAIPIIMGQNIGTCATAILSSIGVNRHAKRVAVIHILFNVIGTAIFMVIYFGVLSVVDMKLLNHSISPVGIAMFHSIFNICTTAMLLPFTNCIVAAAKKLVKTDDAREIVFLDERLLNTPGVAIAECDKQCDKMGLLAKEAMEKAMSILFDYDEEIAAEVKKLESDVDTYEDRIGSYLVKVSVNQLSVADSRSVSKMLHTINDFERISDHAHNIVQDIVDLNEKNLHFSPESMVELRVYSDALQEILDLTFSAYLEQDIAKAERVEPLEQVIDKLTERLTLHHVDRLKEGICTIENGFVLTDLLSNYERVSDHCSNIAVAIIELSRNSLDTHEYLAEAKNMLNEDYRREYEYFEQKYTLPSREKSLA